MSSDIEILRIWIRCLLVICAFTTTLVPLVYSRTPWTETLFGRLFMLHSVSFAFAMDVSLFLWLRPIHNIYVIYLLWTILFFLIAVSTSAMAWKIWYLNYNHHPYRKDSHKDVSYEPGTNKEASSE